MLWFSFFFCLRSTLPSHLIILWKTKSHVFTSSPVSRDKQVQITNHMLVLHYPHFHRLVIFPSCGQYCVRMLQNMDPHQLKVYNQGYIALRICFL